jgi:hypothetical protein
MLLLVFAAASLANDLSMCILGRMFGGYIGIIAVN